MPRGRDTLTALILWVLLLVWTRWVAPHMPEGRSVDAITYALVTASSLALAWRRSFPRWVLAVTAIASVTYMWRAYPYGPALLPFAIAVYTVTRQLPWRSAAIAAGIAVPVLAAHNLSDGPQLNDLAGTFPAGGWVVVPFAIGIVRATRREAVNRDRRDSIERGVHEERLRMAQEVHDIVGHGLAAIKMQADIALHVLDKQPDVARPSLEAISTTSAHALDELRTTLRMLRSAAESQASTPGLADLDALYQRMRAAGLRIRVRTTGDPGSPSPEIALVVYRTIQESLTNVLKHAYPKEAEIVLDNQPDAVRITVTSGFAELTPQSGGMGITGMRERVTSLGGRLTAGPEPDATFIVDAWLPGKVPA
jgi:signal transduction histidine kinase